MPRPLPDVAASRPVPRQGAIAELEAWHRLVICGRPEQVSVARAFIRQVLGVGHPGIERATLLTSELVTNSVNHSDSRLEGGSITVTVRTAGGRVRVEVQDDGGQTAPTLRSDDDLAEAGRGLRLVDAYSLTWDYHQVGTRMVTWFECASEPLALGSVRHKKDLTGCFGAVLCPQGVEDAVTVRAAVGVRTEVVAQGLDEVGRAARLAEPVVVGERGGEGRRRHPVGDRRRYRAPPRPLRRRALRAEAGQHHAAGAALVEPVALHQPAHQFGSRVLQGFIEGSRTAKHHDVVMIFEARPVDFFPFDEVHGEFDVERCLYGTANHFAIALSRVAVAQCWGVTAAA